MFGIVQKDVGKLFGAHVRPGRRPRLGAIEPPSSSSRSNASIDSGRNIIRAPSGTYGSLFRLTSRRTWFWETFRRLARSSIDKRGGGISCADLLFTDFLFTDLLWLRKSCASNSCVSIVTMLECRS